MKIIRVETVPIRIPYTKGYKTSLSTKVVQAAVLVKIYTDEDLVGIGECAPYPSFSGDTQETAKVVIDRYLAPVILNEDPFSLERLSTKMESTLPHHQFAKAAIDIALHDIVGKSLNVPVYKLLGGRCRDQILVSAGIGIGSPEEVREAAEHAVKEGYRTLKVKIGMGVNEDVETVRTIRNAVGDGIKIRVDANQAYNARTAIKIIKKMEVYDLELVEQPVKGWDMEGLARVAHSVDTPIAADESVMTFNAALEVIRRKAADILCLKVAKLGGLTNVRKAAIIADAADMQCWVGTMMETGVGTSANIHFVAATKNIEIASEGVRPPKHLLKDDVVSEYIKMRNGLVDVSSVDRPGLGVELDEEKVKKYSTE